MLSAKVRGTKEKCGATFQGQPREAKKKQRVGRLTTQLRANLLDVRDHCNYQIHGDDDVLGTCNCPSWRLIVNVYCVPKRPSTFLSSFQEKPLIQIYFPLKSTKEKDKKKSRNNKALCNRRQWIKSHTINHLTFAISVESSCSLRSRRIALTGSFCDLETLKITNRIQFVMPQL